MKLLLHRQLQIRSPLTFDKTKKIKPKAIPKSKAQKQSTTRSESASSTAELVSLLKAWRTLEARSNHCPAFRILRDTTLLDIATARPQSESELLAVPGMGSKLLAKYGKKILTLVTEKS